MVLIISIVFAGTSSSVNVSTNDSKIRKTTVDSPLDFNIYVNEKEHRVYEIRLLAKNIEDKQITVDFIFGYILEIWYKAGDARSFPYHITVYTRYSSPFTETFQPDEEIELINITWKGETNNPTAFLTHGNYVKEGVYLFNAGGDVYNVDDGRQCIGYDSTLIDIPARKTAKTKDISSILFILFESYPILQKINSILK